LNGARADEPALERADLARDSEDDSLGMRRRTRNGVRRRFITY
jgi:hypothetical protein